jgi:hypothetical protein
VTYSVTPINFSLLTITLYSPVDQPRGLVVRTSSY